MVIFQKSVQDEVKLTDAQKGDLEKAQEKMRSSMREAFQSAGGDREKMQEAMKTATEATKKEIDKVKESLKPEQTKRLKQLEIQFAGLRAFAEADVQKELKLTDKQKDEIKEISESATKDSQELMATARSGGGRPDPAKLQEVGKKVQAVQKEAQDKVAGLLTDAQKKTWAEMTGEKFDKFERFGQGGRGPGGAGGGGKQRPKSAD
jgi:hypothetical protein